MRALRKLLIIAVVLGGLLVVGDRLAAGVAEREAAGRIQANQGLSTEPDVSIGGFPFLTQLLAKKFDRVDVALTGLEVTAGDRRVRVGELQAELHDVRLEGDYSRAVAATATGTARISYDELRKTSDSDVTLAYGGDGKIKVTGSVEFLGQTVTRSVLSTVSVVDGDTLRVRADEVPGEGLPGIEELIRQRTDFDRPVSGFPAGLAIEKVEAAPDGLAVTVGGRDVVLTG
ncbi:MULTISPECIES: DUF2993 domain-containing protein [Streptomyces]|uniref:DUF2993 domain-containing protein n=2 Tax=Streptomyces TaxID=1883 RepID=A0A100Y4W8_9ACTN|nr:MULTISPECIES: DUF2993 domain-containing protein [Streptomyces]KUH37695.1 hypothetical protein ATE80_16735 [Streptomyces kanasensis]UUS31800.1 DUF2993 domain-containing protein [Streptomyces changanensis]